MAKYGIPYMGSKARIAEKIISFLPSAENFYDLFGGGFSISHCALLSKKWQNIYYNKIDANIVDLIKRAIMGDFNYNNFKPSFISRDEFFKKKDNDAYIRICWSFGNNQKNYLFNKNIESYKKSMHNFAVFNQIDKTVKEALGINQPLLMLDTITKRRLFVEQKVKKRWSENLEKIQQLGQIQHLQKLQPIQRLEKIQQLEQLKKLKKIQFSAKSYDEIEIKQDSIIYCDPPYKNTGSYMKHFDFNKFYSWAENAQFPLFISEYDLNISNFECVFEKKKRIMLSPSKVEAKYKSEKIYANKLGQELLNKRMSGQNSD